MRARGSRHKSSELKRGRRDAADSGARSVGQSRFGRLSQRRLELDVGERGPSEGKIYVVFPFSEADPRRLALFQMQIADLLAVPAWSGPCVVLERDGGARSEGGGCT